MAEIRTATFSSGDVVTTHQPPESVRDWVQRHNDALKNKTPAYEELVTTWPIKDPPGTHSTTTQRESGQSNPAFIAQHIEDYLTDMVSYPPDPS